MNSQLLSLVSFYANILLFFLTDDFGWYAKTADMNPLINPTDFMSTVSPVFLLLLTSNTTLDFGIPDDTEEEKSSNNYLDDIHNNENAPVIIGLEHGHPRCPSPLQALQCVFFV